MLLHHSRFRLQYSMSHLGNVISIPRPTASRPTGPGALPFHSWGLVFGFIESSPEGCIRRVASSNLPGVDDTWREGAQPWARRGAETYAFARGVVAYLRPDWRASFWSRAYFESVTRRFARQFLIPAPVAGARVSRADLHAWMESMGIAPLPLPATLTLSRQSHGGHANA